MSEDPAPTLVLVRDLLFSSRISATAKAHAIPIKLMRNPAQIETQSAQKLIVDLNLEGALDAAIAWKSAHAGQVIGFVSHVDQETISRARAAHIDRILPRSQFVELLSELL